MLAHELTHVVQQRSGVQLEDGIDRPGDPYERQADRVADAVVRGSRPNRWSLRSLPPTASLRGIAWADPALCESICRDAGGANLAGDSALRAVAPSAAAPPKQPSPEQLRGMMEIYLTYNTRNVWAALGEHMRWVQLPTPQPRLTWVDWI